MMKKMSRSPRIGISVSALLLIGAGACDHDPVDLGSRGPFLWPYENRVMTSQYVTMDDGTRIAIDVHLPGPLASDTRIPAILEMTRYWRAREETPSYFLRRAVQRGFAYIVMDERGTGASFGEWNEPLSDRALEDGTQIIDWIIQQPWSNGLVGATGVSYPGMAAQQLAAHGHPALKAVVPMSDTYDQYEDLIFPGGIFNEFFMENWSNIVYAMDRTSTLQIDDDVFQLSPVDSDADGELLQQALAEHQNNLNSYEAIRHTSHRDDITHGGFRLDDMSTHTMAADLAASGVAVYHWASWFDGGSADGAIRQFMETGSPQRAVVGAWTHDLGSNASPFSIFRHPGDPSAEQQVEEALNFFDETLIKERAIQDRTFRYVTIGTTEWKTTSTWPIPGTEMQRFYLGEFRVLTPDAPTTAEGEDSYTVDFSALSSEESRWHGPLFGETWYDRRNYQDTKLLVYETQPLQEDMEVTGYPVIHLYLSSTHTDGAVIVYLEDVDPLGTARYITEVLLRVIHRKVSSDPSPWERPTPYHSYRSEDAEPMIPGEVVELAIGFHPTSVLFRQGHRIRIAIAGHDSGVFRQIPEAGTPELDIQRNSIHPSYIELPVVPIEDEIG